MGRRLLRPRQARLFEVQRQPAQEALQGCAVLVGERCEQVVFVFEVWSGWTATFRKAPRETSQSGADRPGGIDRPPESPGLGADSKVDPHRVPGREGHHVRPRGGHDDGHLRLPRLPDPADSAGGAVEWTSSPCRYPWRATSACSKLSGRYRPKPDLGEGRIAAPRPSPSTARPAVSTWRVRAAEAVTAGWRVAGFVTPGPSAICCVAAPASASSTQTSAFRVLAVGHQKAGEPQASA